MRSGSPRLSRIAAWAWIGVLALGCAPAPPLTGEPVRDAQLRGVYHGRADVVHWGPQAGRYVSWHHHTNRLVPVYTFGTRGFAPDVDLDGYRGARSPYRDASALERLYGGLPAGTLNPHADYFDQTALADLQRAAFAAGKRHLFLVVFDGLDWPLVRAAAIVRSRRVTEARGRGTGLHLLDYDARGTSQFGFVVTSPRDDRHRGRVDDQQVTDGGSGLSGGYDAELGGADPWTPGSDPRYVIEENFGQARRHAVVDSAAAATALCAGVKTYNGAINVDTGGQRLRTVAHELQEAGLAVGVVTSVPISHATPAATYAHNVTRNDYQDLSRDLLGLPSISHPQDPLPGVDVLIGCGHGVERRRDGKQGRNFVAGNRYLTAADLAAVDEANGGRYVVACRRPGDDGGAVLAAAAERAASGGRRLLGFYGVPHGGGHLPYATADGDYAPVAGRKRRAERYSDNELRENPSLAQMTRAALRVLEDHPRGFWLMVEAGDVDWASHDANLDNAVGAVLAGDDAVAAITRWVEERSDWRDALLIVTADHGHYLTLVDPAGLIESRR